MLFLIRNIQKRFDDMEKEEIIYTKPAYCDACEKFSKIHLDQRQNSRFNIAKRCCKILLFVLFFKILELHFFLKIKSG